MSLFLQRSHYCHVNEKLSETATKSCKYKYAYSDLACRCFCTADIADASVFHNKREKPLTSEEAALITSFPSSDMILDAVLILFPSLKLILVCASVIRAINPLFQY